MRSSIAVFVPCDHKAAKGPLSFNPTGQENTCTPNEKHLYNYCATLPQLLFIIECKMWLLTTARSIDQFYLDQKTLHYIYAKATGNITSQRNFHFCMVYFQPSDATRWKGQFNVQKRCPYMQRLKEARKPGFQHLEDSLFRSNNATTLYHVTEMLWYHLKHRLFPNKMWSLLWCNKLPWQRESPAKTPYIWI